MFASWRGEAASSGSCAAHDEGKDGAADQTADPAQFDHARERTAVQLWSFGLNAGAVGMVHPSGQVRRSCVWGMLPNPTTTTGTACEHRAVPCSLSSLKPTSSPVFSCCRGHKRVQGSAIPATDQCVAWQAHASSGWGRMECLKAAGQRG
eukprot:359687-Chlamydomonas_euryale.AAC.8